MTIHRKGNTDTQDDVLKRNLGEAQDTLDTITQDDEVAAARAMIELGTASEKKTQEDKELKIEELERIRGFTKKEYNQKLANMIFEMAKMIDWPYKYTYYVGFDKEKLNIIITAPDGKKFGRGIRPIGIPKYDFHAIGVLLTQCENTIDYIMERGAFRKDGLIIPK